jgi:hypothetical protein
MTKVRDKVAPSWETIDGSRFLLAPLSSFDAIDFQNELSWKNGRGVLSGEGIRIASKAVRDWQDVLDQSGAPVPFTASVVEDLSASVLRQIGIKVFERTFLSEIERKNSSSQSTSD